MGVTELDMTLTSLLLFRNIYLLLPRSRVRDEVASILSVQEARVESLSCESKLGRKTHFQIQNTHREAHTQAFSLSLSPLLASLSQDMAAMTGSWRNNENYRWLSLVRIYHSPSTRSWGKRDSCVWAAPILFICLSV